MKPNSVILFFGKKFELCKVFALFGKENLVYKSEFDHAVYCSSKYVKYYFEKLNCDIVFFDYTIRSTTGSYKPSIDTFEEAIDVSCYENTIIIVSEPDIMDEKCNLYRKKYPNCKLVFLWLYGEVFSKSLFEKCKKANLDLVLSGSNQEGIGEIGVFDYKLSLKYMYWYIGYYYLTELIPNMKEKSYDKNQLPIFTYSKASNESSWRSEILNELHRKFPNKIYNKSSINDSYDLEFTRYKDMEAINDYSHRNYNLIFETINYRNNIEYFTTEKTLKGLFFNNPFYLVAPNGLIKELSKDFYLLNSDFDYSSKIDNSVNTLHPSIFGLDSFVGSESLELDYKKYVEKSKNNLSKLLEIVYNYDYTEHFKKLLNK